MKKLHFRKITISRCRLAAIGKRFLNQKWHFIGKLAKKIAFELNNQKVVVQLIYVAARIKRSGLTSTEIK